MFDFQSIKKEAFRKPCFIVHKSFILCRPGKNYKVNAAVSILKANNPILYDVGIGMEMIDLIKNALNSINKNRSDVGFAIISHIHFDHCMNLAFFHKKFPNSRIILHENAFNILTRKVDQFPTKYDKKLSKYVTDSWKLLIHASYLKKNNIYTYNDDILIPCEGLKLKLIHTPGHSNGHTCLLDCTNKTLFLGDHLPFTPWVDIHSNAIDNMIMSLEKLLRLNSNEVKFSVRNHGNLRDNWREVYRWEEEKNRFKVFLQLIHESLEKIVALLKNRPMTIDEIAINILKNKNYLDYNPLMNFFFMPPNLSWIICYLLKLQKEKKIKTVGTKWVAL